MTWLIRVMLGLTSLYLVVFSIVYAVLNSPQVQNRLIPYLNTELTKALKTKVRIGKVSLDLFDRIVLEDLYWEDQRRQPMITAKKLTVSVISMPTLALLASTNRPKRFFARTVELDDAYLNLYIDKDGGGLNIEKVINALSSDTAKVDTSAPPPLIFEFPSIWIRNMRFHMTDSATKDYANHTPILGRLNFQNLRFKNLQLHAGLRVDENANVFFTCFDLHAYERNSALTLKHFSTQFISTEKIEAKGDTLRNVRFYDTRFRMGDTDLHFDLKMPGMTFSRLFKSGYNRKFDVTFDHSLLDFASLNYFVPEKVPLVGQVKINGSVQGDYTALRSNNLKLIYNDSTRIFAQVKIDRYTQPDSMYMDIKCNDTYLRVVDFETLLPEVKLPAQVRNVRQALIAGSFKGYLHDFKADASLITPLGKVVCDANFRFGAPPNAFYYKGKFQTYEFNLDRLLETQISDRLNFSGTLEGRNTDLATASGSYQFQIGKSNLLGYQLDSCGGTVELKNKIITGNIQLYDPQGNFSGKLKADFSGKMPVYEYDGILQEVDMVHYRITDLPYRMSSRLEGTISGDSLDNLNGKASFHPLVFTDTESGKSLRVDSLSVSTENNSYYHKNIAVTGSDFDLKVLGNFTYDNIVKVIKTVVTEVELEATGDTAGLRKHLEQKKPVPATLALQFQAKKLNPFFRFFEIPIYADDTTTIIEADLDFGDEQFISLTVKSDSLTAGPVSGKNIKTKLDLRAPVLADSYTYTFTLDGDIEAKTLTIADAVTFPNLKCFPRLVRNQLTYNIRMGTDTTSNYLYLEGDGILADKSLTTHIFPQSSHLHLRDSLFTFAENNEIFYRENQLKIKNLRLFNQERELIIQSDIDPPRADILSAQVRNIDLELLNKIIDVGFDLKGNISMEADVFQLFESPIVRANGEIRSIFINKIPMGDLTAKTDWGDEDLGQRLKGEIKWRRENETIAHLKGYYDLKNEHNPLFFTLNGVGFPVELFAKYLSDAVYDLKGTVLFDGIQITGGLDHPVIEGDILADARIGLTFLKQKFSLKDKIRVEKDRFVLDKFRLFNVDALTGKELPKQYADVDGYLSHNNFTDFRYNIRIGNMNRFQLIQTGKHDNTVFYGTGIADGGVLTINGDFKGLKIGSKELKPSRGTVINIPVTNYEKKQRLSYVKFISHGVAELKKEESQSEEGLAIEIDMDVAMTADAEVNIIFDERIGDKISAKGSGNILMTMNRDGEFAMSGKYEIEKGHYLFTFQDLINKSFDVSNGGYLRWTGDPFNASIDLNAVYQTNANMKAWDTTLTNTRVNVNMRMTGTLQQPDIKFNLEVPGIAQSSSPGIAYTMRQIQADQQELNRQVFSLIMLNSVAPIGRFFGQSAGDAASSGATSTLTEFLSNQLNSLIAQTISDNVGVSVNWNRDQVQVNIRASLFNDRVTFERNGAITSGANRDITLGNISVQFRILPGEKGSATQTGILAAEVFNRESFLSQNINAGSSTRGVGLFYRKEFDIVKGDKAKAQKRERKKERKARRELKRNNKK